MQTHKEFSNQALDQLESIVSKALKAGADEADAVIGTGISLSQSCRMGDFEAVERAESQQLGLRVIIGKRQAIVSSNVFTKETERALIERAVAMAGQVPENQWCGLASADEIVTNCIDANSETEDEIEPTTQILAERASMAENAALAHEGITNSSGSEAGWSHSRVAIYASNGFRGARSSTRHSVGVHVIAGTGLEMEGDYDFATTVYGSDLPPCTEIGDKAAIRALERLNPKRPPTGSVPIIFDRRVSSSLISSFASAINGQAIARKTSFLQDAMGEALFSPEITIFDDPLRKRGLASRKFDGDGLPCVPRAFIEKGILSSWALDIVSARQLGLKSTGNAVRGIASLPHPGMSNLTLHCGKQSTESLYKDEGGCFIVTHLMGMGVNLVTGDYSQGASGFWVEKGEVAYPVNEATIAGNLKSMFLNLIPGDDLEYKGSINAPSVRIDGMTLASG